MKEKRRNKLLSYVVLLTFLFSNVINIVGIKKAYAQGTGTWESPFSVSQAIAIQDNRVGTVEGYIVGVPTAANTVQFENFTSDTAIAIADNIGERDTAKMLYLQLPLSFRADFALKGHPERMGMKIKATGNLTPYFTPHQGLKTLTKIEKVNTETVPVSEIVLDKTSASIEEGQTLKLTATVFPENATNKSISWSSSNPLAAEVNNGVVTGIKQGEAVITATAEGGKTASCSIVVTEKPGGDLNGPEVTNITPGSGDYTGDNQRPEIGADYRDASGISLESIRLYVDGIDVTGKASITESRISYTPEANLEMGQHMVKLEVRDKAENSNLSVVEWNFYVGKEVYNTYFGQLHSHTNYSDGQGTPEEAYNWAKNTAKADFFAVTDHSNSLDNDTSATILDGSMSSEWKNLHLTADKYNENGKFAAIAGYEMTWSGSTGGWGHINTFNTNGFLSRNSKIGGKAVDLQTYYNEIKKVPESISQLNHPGSTFGDFGDFGYYDPQVDRVVSLIEVGNGEGAVRSSGYFPSYDLYTRALDKGWHVAPTNNQDNHKANWVTANNARTVVLAPNLSRESIYDALRNMRVYSTEDSNLRVNYKVNNKVMGSSLSKPGSLDISIDITDMDMEEKIGKVSIIANGGVVVSSKTFDTNTASWNLKLNPQYNYYYVRVDQPDKDIAVTAPVWTGESASAGLSKVSASQNLYTTNSKVDLTASVYNNGSTELQPVNVEFFLNEILPENKIGEALTEKIPSGGTKNASIDWTPSKPGSYIVYAKTTISLNGEEKVSTESTKLEVLNSEDITKVVVDAGHYNQYVSGDYAGKIAALKSMLGDRKFLLYENRDELTSEDLKDAKILILTDPQSKDKATYNLYKSYYKDSEVAAIKGYVENGGNLIITSRADYDDKGITDEIYETANQGNKVLEAIGSNLRFNDDEVIDKATNGGQEFRLYFNRYTSSKYGITNNIPRDLTYSAYSGCSVILKDGGSDEWVDWLVKGHDTTEILDSDLQNDAIPVSKGDVNSIAAETLPGGGKVVAAGTTFFSDFELTGDNVYANKQITENILGWMTRPDLKTIAEARVDADKDGKPDNLGKRFTVEGRVTAASKAAVKNTAFFDVFYIQDETGGITVFGVSGKALPLGAKVRVVGVVDQYDGDAELQISNENMDIEILDDSISLVEPRVMSTVESMLEENEGYLVKTEGIVTRITENSIYLNDGSGEARIYVNGYIGDDTDNPDMLGKWDKNIKMGDHVSAIGLASEDPEGHRLRVRNTSEIVKVKTPVTGVILDVTETSLNQGENMQLTASVNPADATYKEVEWSSSNPWVASVDQNGKVTAVDGGEAVITVRTIDGGYEAHCIINVKVPVRGVELNRESITLRRGQSEVLTAVILPVNATNKNLVWSVENPEIASVDKDGRVTGLSIGVTKVTVKTEDGGYVDSCEVVVVKVPVSGIRLNKEILTLETGKHQRIVAHINPGNASIKDVVWTSSDESIATVDSTGNITAKTPGTVVIRATTVDGRYSAECKVTVFEKGKGDIIPAIEKLFSCVVQSVIFSWMNFWF